MTDNHIRQILEKLEEQNVEIRSLKSYAKSIEDRVKALETRVEPIAKLADNVTGFRNTSSYILKGLIVFGAAVGVLYGFINWLRN